MNREFKYVQKNMSQLPKARKYEKLQNCIDLVLSVDLNQRENLAGDFNCATIALGVGLFGDPLAALVRVRERVPWLLV